jgi:glycolate oxidase FAD binding subunit
MCGERITSLNEDIQPFEQEYLDLGNSTKLAALFAAILPPTCIHHTSESRAIYAIEGCIPRLVLIPETSEEVAAALHLASTHDLAIVPWGSGSEMTLGFPLTRIDVVLSLERLKHISPPDLESQTITVGAGVTQRELNNVLAEHGYTIALDGPLETRATIGGRIASGRIGLRKESYGTIQDLIQNLQVARCDGTLIHTGGLVIRHLLGYNLNRLFVGSLGTLGIIVDVTLKLTRIPEHEATVIATFADSFTIWSLLQDLHAGSLNSISMAACGSGTLGLDRGLTPVQVDILEPASHPLLVVRVGGSSDVVRRQALMVHALCHKFGTRNILMVRGENQQSIWEALEDLPATVSLSPTEAIMRVAVLPSEVGHVVEFTRGFCMEHDLRIAWLADTKSGIVWVRIMKEIAGYKLRHQGDGITFVNPFLSDPLQESSFATALHALQVSLTQRWRNATVLGCPVALKSDLPIWGAGAQGIEILRLLKRRLDPTNTLNPGRFG